MPLEKYYCDYCDRTINDNAESRRTHFDSSSHKRCVKMHYDSLQGYNLNLTSLQPFLPPLHFTNYFVQKLLYYYYYYYYYY